MNTNDYWQAKVDERTMRQAEWKERASWLRMSRMEAEMCECHKTAEEYRQRLSQHYLGKTIALVLDPYYIVMHETISSRRPGEMLGTPWCKTFQMTF